MWLFHFEHLEAGSVLAEGNGRAVLGQVAATRGALKNGFDGGTRLAY